jgi:hypothetical protein
MPAGTSGSQTGRRHSQTAGRHPISALPGDHNTLATMSGPMTMMPSGTIAARAGGAPGTRMEGAWRSRNPLEGPEHLLCGTGLPMTYGYSASAGHDL